MEAVLRAGADKVSVNSAAIKNPKLITEIANRFGSQCLVISIQAKRTKEHWEAYFDNGREHSGLDAIEWAQRCEKLGAGEIVTSVDQEGTKKGFDIPLVKAITSQISIPVIASGGMGNLTDINPIIDEANADAIAMAHVLHYNTYNVNEIREHCINTNISVRDMKVV